MGVRARTRNRKLFCRRKNRNWVLRFRMHRYEQLTRTETKWSLLLGSKDLWQTRNHHDKHRHDNEAIPTIQASRCATSTELFASILRLTSSLVGYHKYSIAYTSTGARRVNQPFNPTLYGPQYVQGDVIGVGYRPRTGTIFFTRNGKRLDDVAHGLKSQNFFPSVGANGPCTVHVNFGQAGFVFIEANVKKWGLAPITGSLAPPPPYGSEQGSILLESGRRKDEYSGSPAGGHGYTQSVQRYTNTPTQNQGHGRTRSGNFRVLPPTSPGPQRSPTDISLAQLVPSDEVGEPSNSGNAARAPGDHVVDVIGLGLHEASHPPPEYTSPEHSDEDNSSSGSDSDRVPLIRAVRSRGASAATIRPSNPPIPSYSDAVRQGAGRDRSHSESAMSRRDGNWINYRGRHLQMTIRLRALLLSIRSPRPAKSWF